MEAELVTILDELRVARLCHVSAAVIVLYDHILSLDQEVDLIWKRPDSLVSMLYFLNRYVGDAIIILSAALNVSTTFSVKVGVIVLLLIDQELTSGPRRTFDFFCLMGILTTTIIMEFFISCSILLNFEIWGPFFLSWCTQVIMQLRIYAMYMKSWKISTATAIFFAMEIAGVSYIVATNFDTIVTYTHEPIPGMYMCSSSPLGKGFTAAFIPVFCFELLLFFLAAYVAYKHMAQTRNVSGSRRLLTTMSMLVRHSTVYFFVGMSGCAIAVAMHMTLPALNTETVNPFLVATTIIVGSRLVINTREFYSHSEEDEIWSGRSTVSQLHSRVGGHAMEMSVRGDGRYLSHGKYGGDGYRNDRKGSDV
ncbi:hypothetical protein BDN67DRAFT_1010221 [Paxillus ammoniavirescens]|nr:hypothetical protein BDN67DRAFT_1010221 [Paxillus ammoniavirescens]